MIATLLAVTLGQQDLPLDAVYRGGTDLKADGAVTCDYSFIPGPRRPTGIEVNCSAGEELDAVTARAREALNWESSRILNRRETGEAVRGTLVLRENTGDPGQPAWRVDLTQVMTSEPRYPDSQARAGHQAACLVTFHLIDLQPDIQDVRCETQGFEDAFRRAARQAVERYVFIGDGNAYCWTTIVDFTPISFLVMEPPTPPECVPPDGLGK